MIHLNKKQNKKIEKRRRCLGILINQTFKIHRLKNGLLNSVKIKTSKWAINEKKNFISNIFAIFQLEFFIYNKNDLTKTQMIHWKIKENWIKKYQKKALLHYSYLRLWYILPQTNADSCFYFIFVLSISCILNSVSLSIKKSKY